MCDVKKYSQIYEDITQLQPEDTLELIINSKDPDEKKFFEFVGDFLLQKKQRTVIAEKMF